MTVKNTVAAGAVLLAAAAYLVFMTEQVSASTSSDVASDYDPESNILDYGAQYGDAGSGFNASGRTEQIQDNESTDMEGGMVGL